MDLDSLGVLLCGMLMISFALIYRIITKDRSDKPDYSKQIYWEQRYSLFSEAFEWYGDFKKILKDFSLTGLIKRFDRKAKVLELGCGSSMLSVELEGLGFEDITAVDFSFSIISEQKKSNHTSKVKFLVRDFTQLSKSINQGDIDLVIDKAGIDSLISPDDKKVSKQMKKVFHELYTILRPGGTIITISNRKSEYWRRVIHQYLEESKLFIIDESSKGVFTIKGSTIPINYYCYILKRLK